MIDLTHDQRIVGSDAPTGPFGGMHISYDVRPPSPRGRYISIQWKFALAVAFAFAWLGISIWLSIPWIEGLATVIPLPAAIMVVAMLAFLPGFVIALLTGGLLLDRQPPLKVASPRAAVTVLIAARNEAAVIGETIGSLARQDYEGELRVVLIDNGSVDRTSAVAHTAAAVSGLDLEVLHEATAGKELRPEPWARTRRDGAADHRRRRHAAPVFGDPPADRATRVLAPRCPRRGGRSPGAQ